MGVAASGCGEGDAGLELAAKRAYMIRRVAVVVTFADVLRRGWRAVIEFGAGPCGPPVFMLEARRSNNCAPAFTYGVRRHGEPSPFSDFRFVGVPLIVRAARLAGVRLGHLLFRSRRARCVVEVSGLATLEQERSDAT
jgi:hypothetical protein